ncbi:MAG: entericidin A/B family lipoprotein [Methylophilaceae bacterium]|nr:entericidin A/B family lipoprotein [Methylophilaceae bacterium]
MQRFVVYLLCSILLAGCNTIRGMGKDLEQAGEAIQRSTK